MLMATLVDDSVNVFYNDSLFDEFIVHVKCAVLIDVSKLEHICGMCVKCNIEHSVTTVDQTKYI
jgi:hypothetical protein